MPLPYLRGRFGRLLSLAAALAAGLLAAQPVAAQDAPSGRSRPKVEAAPMTPEDREAVRKVEDYLNSLTTLSARFEQSDSAGKTASGLIYLAKPGKLRFEYDPPVPVLIVANGRFLIHYDKSLKTASYIPQDRTPAWFLVTPRVRLSGEVTVTDIGRRDGKLLLTLVKTLEPGQGKVTLVFDQDPIRLDQWEVTDPQGIVTHVVLKDVLTGGSIDSELFEFNEPTWDQRGSLR